MLRVEEVLERSEEPRLKEVLDKVEYDDSEVADVGRSVNEKVSGLPDDGVTYVLLVEREA